MKIPIYLSGAIRQEIAGREEFGYMRTPKMGNRPVEGSVWFADNGCFSSKGEREFKLDEYLTWLRSQDEKTCLGATAPDKVGQAVETVKRSRPVLPLLRQIGYAASFVAQDGLSVNSEGSLVAKSETEELSISWDEFDVLFIGGSTEYKLGATLAAVVKEAKSRGKWVHMGRVNSFKRWLYAASIECDSVDGTFLAFGPVKNLLRMQVWIDKLKSMGGYFEKVNLSVRWNQQTV